MTTTEIRAEKDRLIAEGKIRRDKPMAAIAEDEKPFDLPVGWVGVGKVESNCRQSFRKNA